MTTVPRAARSIASAWHGLEATGGDGEVFRPEMCATLPDPVRRWLTSSIAAGSPLARRVRLTMGGSIFLRSWRTFHADQLIVAGHGFIWAARTRVGGLSVQGFDRFTGSDGEMRWKMVGLVPVVTATGPDVSRSAAGRLAGESVLVPTSLPGASWRAVDAASAEVVWTLPGGYTESVTIECTAAGDLRRIHMQRWGDPFGQGFARYPFVVDLSEPRTFGGITIPTRWAARWEDPVTATRLEFFRAEIADAVFG
ncbi:DUF6544 family protein [Gordonia terrae]|uniref:DUF6544 family protein n=1 Tax=Gordonia terrae TaxID=2055 RepID=UPI003F6BFF47